MAVVMGRHVAALALLACAALALLVAHSPAHYRSELAALRLPALVEPILPEPGYQTGFPEVCRRPSPYPLCPHL
jgi:hypothetical protein